MIEPASIPEFTGDLKQLEKDISGLRGDAITIRDGGMQAHSRFQMLEGFYKAPEAEQLLSSTWPVATKADAFASDLESVADALDTLASEIRPLIKRLARLKADAFTFVASVEGDDDWTEDDDKVDRHQQLWDDVNAAVAAFQEAERKASTTISGLVGGPKFVADDGSHTQNRKKVMYGYDLDALDQAKELPWGSPVSQTYDALDFGHHFKSFLWDGIVVDNIWGGFKGLKTLTGFDGGDKASKAWGHLGDIAGGIGQYSIKPYDMLMDWTIGEDKESPEEARQKQAAKDFGKSLVAWDMWDENPARASGTVVFNVLTLGTLKVAAGASGGAEAGAAARGAAVAARVGDYMDPLSAAFKVSGKAVHALPKISEVTAKIGASIDAAPNSPHLISHIDLPDGSRVRVQDGEFFHLDADGHRIEDASPHEPANGAGASDHSAGDDMSPPGAARAGGGEGGHSPDGGGDGSGRPNLVRQDDNFHSEHNHKGQRKSHLNADGDLVPANPDGEASVVDHIVGRDPAKSDSPFTSLSREGADAKSFGTGKIRVDLPRLEQAIASGRVTGVEVYSPEQVQAAIQESANKIAGSPVDLTVPPGATRADIQGVAESLGLSKGKTKRIVQRMIDMKNTMRDEEWLIKGTVPHDYISGP